MTRFMVVNGCLYLIKVANHIASSQEQELFLKYFIPAKTSKSVMSGINSILFLKKRHTDKSSFIFHHHIARTTIIHITLPEPQLFN